MKGVRFKLTIFSKSYLHENPLVERSSSRSFNRRIQEDQKDYTPLAVFKENVQVSGGKILHRIGTNASHHDKIFKISLQRNGSGSKSGIFTVILFRYSSLLSLLQRGLQNFKFYTSQTDLLIQRLLTQQIYLQKFTKST